MSRDFRFTTKKLNGFKVIKKAISITDIAFFYSNNIKIS
tara:strand:+ start:4172 stop:4288 length:117 start_codon:yes stop_codon:yes gene_type:complete